MADEQQRLEWLDTFRGLAVLGMIWVHAVNTLLDEGMRAEGLYPELIFYHGLVAPSFFWIMGYVRGWLWEKWKGRPVGGALRKLGAIALMGYALHCPVEAFVKGTLSPQDWREFLGVDVLQTLAITGMLLVLLGRGGSRGTVLGRVGAVLLVWMLLSPRLLEIRSGWLPLDAWWREDAGARFPLVPWLGFGLWGFAMGLGTPLLRRRVGVGMGWVLGLVGILGAPWLKELFGSMTGFFLERLAWVLLLAVMTVVLLEPMRLWLAGKKWGMFAAEVLPFAGRHSLFLYVVHLILLHWVLLPGGSLEQRVGRTQSWAQVSLWWLLLAAVSLSLAAGWQRWRRHQ